MDHVGQEDIHDAVIKGKINHLLPYLDDITTDLLYVTFFLQSNYLEKPSNEFERGKLKMNINFDEISMIADKLFINKKMDLGSDKEID